MNSTKKHIILDTDVYNEIDDQFAIAYLLSNDSKYFIDGINIAPYRVEHQKNISVADGQALSYEETLKILKLFNKSYPVYKGSNGFVQEGYKEITPAVQAIIDNCRKNKQTTILAIGPLTNIAIAITNAPDIIDKISIIWIGTGHPFKATFNDTNFKADYLAVKKVLDSGADLTIVSTVLAKALRLSVFEAKARFKKSKITDYLIKRMKGFYYYNFNGNCFTCHDIIPIDMIVNPQNYEVQECCRPKLTKTYGFNYSGGKGKIKFLVWLNHYQVMTNLFEAINNS